MLRVQEAFASSSTFQHKFCRDLVDVCIFSDDVVFVVVVGVVVVVVVVVSCYC